MRVISEQSACPYLNTQGIFSPFLVTSQGDQPRLTHLKLIYSHFIAYSLFIAYLLTIW